MQIPGRHALYLGQDLVFRRPVLIGDAVTASVKVLSKNPTTRTIVLTTEILTKDDKVAVSGPAKVKVSTRSIPEVKQSGDTKSRKPLRQKKKQYSGPLSPST